MYTDELIKSANQLGIKNFIGVFPLNKLPSSLTCYPKPFNFIVNTDTSNLPGRHWIAVSWSQHGIVRAFDPLGMFYPPVLSEYLARRAKHVIFNRITYQDPSQRTCGQHCLLWLRSINAR